MTEPRNQNSDLMNKSLFIEVLQVEVSMDNKISHRTEHMVTMHELEVSAAISKVPTMIQCIRKRVYTMPLKIRYLLATKQPECN